MCHDPAACDEAIAYWDALYAAETAEEAQMREAAERAVRERETAMASMSEARLAEIRNWFDGESHSITDDMAHDLLAEVERLRAREAALLAVVRAVAEADNSDNSVCYQVCDYSMHGDWMIEHEAPCVVKQAHTLLASTAAVERSGGDGA